MTSQSHKLLLDEPLLAVQPGLARLFGLLPALLLQQIHYYLGIGGITDPDGNHWTWQKISKLRSDVGDCADETTIARALGRLIAAEILLVADAAKINPQIDPRDRTKAYRINYIAIEKARGGGGDNSKNKMQTAKCKIATSNQQGCRPTKSRSVYRTEISHRNYKIDNAAAAPAAGTAAGTAAGAAAAAPAPETKFLRKRVRPSGIQCWYQSDITSAEKIEAEEPAEAIRAAVEAVEARGQDPVPGLVLREIRRTQHAAALQPAKKSRGIQAMEALDELVALLNAPRRSAAPAIELDVLPPLSLPSAE